MPTSANSGKCPIRHISRELNKLFTSAKDAPEFNAIELLALRTMAKARYDVNNIGHYGLAFSYYTHFTSPIRRYPDLMVHRLLAEYLAGGKSADREYYAQACNYASQREVVAAEAERASIKYKLVEFMQDKLGQEFTGHISGLTEWGMYVEIEPTKIEGMVPLREVKSDFFEFDSERYRLVGRRSHRVFNLGDEVKIRVKKANLEQSLLDYELVEADIPFAKPAPETPAGKTSDKTSGKASGKSSGKSSGAAGKSSSKSRRIKTTSFSSKKKTSGSGKSKSGSRKSRKSQKE